MTWEARSLLAIPVLFLFSAASPSAAAAQWPEGAPAPVLAGEVPVLDEEEEGWPRWQLGLASAVLPGAGQLARGQARGWAYLVAEVLIWGGVVHERDRGHEARFAYRDLAWRVARGENGVREDGDFEYYERLAAWERSGAFDRDPVAPGVQPEQDPATFNGDAWRLARAIHLGTGPEDPSNPGWDAAVAYYRDRAYGGELQWDWSPSPDAFRRFGLLIDESDSRFARASLIAGAAVLNRMVSTLDVVLTRATGRDTRLRIIQPSTSLSGPEPFRTGLFIQIRSP